ncbi:MAG: glycosyl hydrolase [Bacteroidales bacterium]
MSYTLVDPKATQSVHSVWSFLTKDTDKIMFGHQDSLSYGIGWKYADNPQKADSDIYRVCGDFPAFFGWDLGHIETGSTLNIDKVPFDDMRKNIQKAYTMGGIQTISWHPTNPITGGDTWDTSVRVLEKILPGGTHHHQFTQWLDAIADFMLSLIDEKGTAIPVIFRPYHEHTGNWFWWGDELCSREEYINLWEFTITHLRDTRNCHNLLYCYSTDKVTSKEQYLNKYPGNEWVDILGIDVYDFPHQGVDFEKVLPECLRILEKIGKDVQKPYALTETGNLCVEPETWWTQSLLKLTHPFNIKWFLVWINIEQAQYYGPHPQNKSADDFVSFYKHPQTAFLKDIVIDNS